MTACLPIVLGAAGGGAEEEEEEEDAYCERGIGPCLLNGILVFVDVL